MTAPTGRLITCTVAASCVLASLAGVVLLGLPGAILYQAFSRLEYRPGFEAVKPDAGWPIGLMVSILWPWGILLANVLARRLGFRKRAVSTVLLFELIWLWLICFVLSIVPE